MPTSRYSVEIRPAAARALKKLTPDALRPVTAAIDALAVTPRPHGVKKLTDMEGLHRIRVGAFRILYTIEDRVLRIVVVDVGDRRDIYR
jgi:mRNA interferase RelE/StbE